MKDKKFLIIGVLDGLVTSLVCAWLAYVLLDERIAIAGDVIGLQKAFNDGIAFGLSLGPLQTGFIFLAMALIAKVAWDAQNPLEQIGFGCILGGGMANIIDRLHDGYVTDMIQIGTFPIFNVADVYINVGVALVLIAALRSSMKTRGT